MNKTCFIISPIGPKDSDIRKKADDLLELIIKPSLQIFDFTVTRADQIQRPTVITSDIIKNVQMADLCIIDLTDNNPNVFYECGRRHENGKPFIQLVEENNDLPFDVAGIRTITYSLSTPHSVNKAVKEIQSFITEIITNDFQEKSPGDSLTSIAGTLERIERKINTLNMNKSANVNITKTKGSKTSIIDSLELQANPLKAFKNAFQNGDLLGMRQTLPLLIDTEGYTHDTVLSMALLVSVGDQFAKNMLMTFITGTDFKDIDNEILFTSLLSLEKFYVQRDEESQAVSELIPLIENAINYKKYNDKYTAQLLNSIQKIYYGTQNYDKAYTIIEKILDLMPNEPGYYYNASLICDKLSKSTKAKEHIDRCLALQDEFDSDHYKHALLINYKLRDYNRVKELFNEFWTGNEEDAQSFLEDNDELRQAFI